MKINVRDCKAVNCQLGKVQGRARVNLLSSIDVVRFSIIAQRALDELLPKGKQVGATYRFCFAGPSAAAYTYSQGASSLELTKGTTGWFVTNLERVKVWSKTPKIGLIVLSEMQNKIAAARLLKLYLQVDDECELN